MYIYGGFNLIPGELVIVRDSTTSTTQQPVQLWQQNWNLKTLKWKEKQFRSSVSVCAVPSIDLHWLPFDIRKQAHLLVRTSPNHCDLHANSRSVVLYSFTCSAHLLSCGDFNRFWYQKAGRWAVCYEVLTPRCPNHNGCEHMVRIISSWCLLQLARVDKRDALPSSGMPWPS